MSDDIEQSGGRPLTSIGPTTPLKMPLAWTVTAAVGVICIVSGATTMYLAIKADLHAQSERLSGHISDTSVHLDPATTTAHGYPVGHADYALDIYRLSESIAALKDRPILVGRDCRQTLTGFICDQKR